MSGITAEFCNSKVYKSGSSVQEYRVVVRFIEKIMRFNEVARAIKMLVESTPNSLT